MSRSYLKGTRQLEEYVRQFGIGTMQGVEAVCERLSRTAVIKAREQIALKGMTLSGALAESLRPIPGPYFNKETNTAKIGITQLGQGSPADYGAVQEFGKKNWNKVALPKLFWYARQRWGLTGRQQWASAKGLQKKILKRGIKGKEFAYDALNNLLPEVTGKLHHGMRDVNGEAVAKAKRYAKTR
jgi:hypothetical protein